MDVGVALPTMAGDYDRSTTLRWAAGVDAGPFSSISCGERFTFRNQEMLVTMAAAAAVTERVGIFCNLAVLPLHPVAVLAKQVATLDVLSGGRVTLGVGVGGRDHDYRAADSTTDRRHQRLDEGVAELRRIWAGEPPFDGADPVGAPGGEPGGPPQRAGAMGPKALARAARWADGGSGFALTADGAELAAAASAARQAWGDAGRDRPPRVVSGCFVVVGVPGAQQVLQRFTYDYLEIFGRGLARSLGDSAPVWNGDRLAQVLDDAEAAGVDEFILVPGTTDPDCLEALAAAVAGRA
jgi:alkanesulfonate monooxygenase SsuD/methylene tetrahydromethanopterin reductase-like flavin-dependent oxidoreductase (luciferase family)